MRIKKVSVDKYSHFIEDYLSLRLDLHHQESSIIAARKDLNMFLRYLREHKIKRFSASTVLDYMSWLRKKRKNVSGTINRKINSVKMYVRHLSMRGVPGAKEMPVDEIPRARDP